MDIGGTEVASPIDREQVMAIQKNEFFEHTAALQFMKQIGEAFIELIDFDGIEDVSHLCVTGNLIDAVKILERGIIQTILKRQ